MEATCKLGEKGCWNDGKCRATLNCECKVITNADRIRAMSDEELAAVILCTKQFDMNATCDRITCHQCALNWLKRPVKGGEDDG